MAPISSIWYKYCIGKGCWFVCLSLPIFVSFFFFLSYYKPHKMLFLVDYTWITKVIFIWHLSDAVICHSFPVSLYIILILWDYLVSMFLS